MVAVFVLVRVRGQSGVELTVISMPVFDRGLRCGVYGLSGVVYKLPKTPRDFTSSLFALARNSSILRI